MSDNLTLLGFGQFLVLIFIAWWAWTGETLYQNRLVVDDLWHRVLVFIQMFGVAAIGLSVSKAFGELYIQFTVGYALARFVLILMYARTYMGHLESKSFSAQYMIGFAGGIIIWLVALLLPSAYRWVAWVSAIVFEIVFFTRPAIVRELLKWSTDAHHMVERFGIFTIIVLGEAFVKVLDDAQGTALGMQQVLFSIGGIWVLYSLWWLYFSDTAGKLYNPSSGLKAVLWSYGHLILAVSLVAFGVAAKKLFAETIKYPDYPLTEEYRLLYMVAVTIFLFALSLINFGLDKKQRPKNPITTIAVYLGGAVAVVIIGGFVTGATAAQFIAINAVLMLALVVFNAYQSVAS